MVLGTLGLAVLLAMVSAIVLAVVVAVGVERWKRREVDALLW